MTNPDAVWRIPEPLYAFDAQVDADAVVTVRRHGNPAGPRLILSHGNGLAIDLYYPLWSLLTDEFDVVVYDMRNHGGNPLSPLPQHNIPTLVSDHDVILDAIQQRFGVKPTVGVYHSVAALVSLLSPAQGSGYAAMVLFDPPLRRANLTDEQFDAVSMHIAARTRQRTVRFPSIEAYAEFLQYVPAFQRLAPGAHTLMAQSTLRPRAGGDGFELCCPAEYEAQIIDYARIFSLAVDFETLQCPLKVIGADPTLPLAYLPTLDLSDVVTAHYDFIPDTTHFLPIEKPEECAAALREFLSSVLTA